MNENEILESIDFEDLYAHISCGNPIDITRRNMQELIDTYMNAKNYFKCKTYPADSQIAFSETDWQGAIIDKILSYLIEIDVVTTKTLVTSKNHAPYLLYSVIKSSNDIIKVLKDNDINIRCADQFRQIINAMERQGLKKKTGLNFIMQIIKTYQRYHENT